MLEISIFIAIIVMDYLTNKLYLKDLLGFITYRNHKGYKAIDFALLKSNNRIVRSLITKALPLVLIELGLVGWLIYELFV